MMKKAIVFVLLGLFSLPAFSLCTGILSWEYDEIYNDWLTGFSFHINGVQVGTVDSTARSSACADIGITPTDGAITMKAFREGEESMAVPLRINLLTPNYFSHVAP